MALKCQFVTLMLEMVANRSILAWDATKWRRPDIGRTVVRLATSSPNSETQQLHQIVCRRLRCSRSRADRPTDIESLHDHGCINMPSVRLTTFANWLGTTPSAVGLTNALNLTDQSKSVSAIVSNT
jgi:hypothetical protein